MQSKNHFIKIFLTAIILADLLSAAAVFVAFAQPDGTGFIDPNSPQTNIIPRSMTEGYTPKYLPPQLVNFSSLGELTNNLYKYSVGAIGLVAFGVLVWAGYLRVTSAGNPGAVTNSNEWIKSALFGVLLLAGGFILLNTLNREITDISGIDQKIDLKLKRQDDPVVRTFDRFSNFMFGDSDTIDSNNALATSTLIARGGSIQGCEGRSLAQCAQDPYNRPIILDTLEKIPGAEISAKNEVSFVGVQQGTLEAIRTMAMGLKNSSGSPAPVVITSLTDGNHAECDAGNKNCLDHKGGFKWDMRIYSEKQDGVSAGHFYANKAQFERIAPRSDSSDAYKDKITGAVCYLEDKGKGDPHWDCEVGA